MHGVRDKLRSILVSDQGQNLIRSLHTTWPASEAKEIETFFADDDTVTLQLRGSGRYERFQIVNYNFVHGSLLVDGEPLGVSILFIPNCQVMNDTDCYSTETIDR